MAPSVKKFVHSFNNKLEEPVRSHLKNVYACLTLSSLSAAGGAAVHLYTDFLQAGFLPALGAIILFGILMCTSNDYAKQVHKRIGYLTGFSFLTGLGMGPILEQVILVNPNIIATALIGAAVVFVSFSICSVFAERGKWLYFGGTLLALMNSLVLLSLANMFVQHTLITQMHLYLALIMMCGFVLYDTQLIIEKRRFGNKDFVTHSLDLFIDFVGIFRRLLVILTQKERESRKQRN